MTEIFNRHNNEWIISLNKDYLLIRNFANVIVYNKSFSKSEKDKWINMGTSLKSPWHKVVDTNSEIKTIIKALFNGKKFSEFGQ